MSAISLNMVPALKEKNMTSSRKPMEKTVVKRLLFFIRAVSMLTNRPARPPTPKGSRGARKTVIISTGQKAAGRSPMTI